MLIILLTGRIVRGAMEFKEIPSFIQAEVYAELLANGVESLAGEYKPTH